MKISVVIPVYKNHELFLKNLEHNLKLLNQVEFIIVDDDPKSNLEKNIRKYGVIYLKNEKNYGFSKTVNMGVKKASGDLIILLNSDVKVLKLDLRKIKDYFQKDKTLFAISFLQFDNGKTVGRNCLYWKKGFFYHTKIENFNEGINSWAEGGACVIDKKKFLFLGGFLDNLYSPFYWEDIDLSYRAWKAEFKIIFSPKFKVEHLHESTIGKYFKKEFVRRIAYRNSFLFIWVNLTSLSKFVEHLIFLPFYFFKIGIKDKELIKAFFLALRFLPKVILQRLKFGKKIKKRDEEILEIFKKGLLEEK